MDPRLFLRNIITIDFNGVETFLKSFSVHWKKKTLIVARQEGGKTMESTGCFKTILSSFVVPRQETNRMYLYDENRGKYLL